MARPAAPVAVAVLLPLAGLQVAVALPPTATTLTVLLLDWRITLVWRTVRMRTERWRAPALVANAAHSIMTPMMIVKFRRAETYVMLVAPCWMVVFLLANRVSEKEYT
jgi:hypothetical protein